jgi:CYTH domain-containing protein
MAIEIELEKTYLAKDFPDGLESAKSIVIRDVYIPEESARHLYLRLRQKGNMYEITKKIPLEKGDASGHYEHTIPLTREEYEAMVRVSNKDFVKTRYFMKINGADAEVDVYEEKLTGLVVIDFEFATKKAMDVFITPEICLAEVTQDDVVAGGYLAGKSYDDIADLLKRYNYKKLG